MTRPEFLDCFAPLAKTAWGVLARLCWCLLALILSVCAVPSRSHAPVPGLSSTSPIIAATAAFNGARSSRVKASASSASRGL